MSVPADRLAVYDVVPPPSPASTTAPLTERGPHPDSPSADTKPDKCCRVVSPMSQPSGCTHHLNRL